MWLPLFIVRAGREAVSTVRMVTYNDGIFVYVGANLVIALIQAITRITPTG